MKGWAELDGEKAIQGLELNRSNGQKGTCIKQLPGCLVCALAGDAEINKVKILLFPAS